MTDRQALFAIIDHNIWGSCEELAYPAMSNFVTLHLAGDPNAEIWYKMHAEKIPYDSNEIHRIEEKLKHMKIPTIEQDKNQ